MDSLCPWGAELGQAPVNEPQLALLVVNGDVVGLRTRGTVAAVHTQGAGRKPRAVFD